MISTSDFQKGKAILFKNEPHFITHCEFVFPGKGNAFVKTKLKNLKTGKTLEHVFKSGEQVEEADISFTNVTYLYNDGSSYFFMDNKTYNQQPVSAEVVGDRVKYLLENTEVKGLFLGENLFDIELPFKMVFKVIESPPGVKGNSAQGASKVATIETGGKITVPLFINEGDKIRVNTETGEYVERVND